MGYEERDISMRQYWDGWCREKVLTEELDGLTYCAEEISSAIRWMPSSGGCNKFQHTMDGILADEQNIILLPENELKKKRGNK